MSREPLLVKIGDKFGRLTVVSMAKSKPNGRYVVCKCDCGNIKEVRLSTVYNGVVVSCGCFRRESASKSASKRNYKHGGCGTPEYVLWTHMWERCTVPSCKNFPRYGGKGVRVHPRWKSFAVFLKDMGPRPSPIHSLDRFPNQFGDYELGNVRWATPTEQARNRSNNRLLTHNGVTQTVAEWAEDLGLSRHVILNRLKAGWPVKKTLKTPARRWVRKGDD